MAFYQRGMQNQREFEEYIDKPSRYNGKGVPAGAWLEQVNAYFDATGVSARHRAALTAYFLDGKALLYHFDYVSSLVPAPKYEAYAKGKLRAMDWEAYMAAMVLYLDPPRPPRRCR